MIRTVLAKSVLTKSFTSKLLASKAYVTAASTIATLALTSSLLPGLAVAKDSANTVAKSLASSAAKSPAQNFDCSALGNDQQVETYAHDLPPLVLRGLAQTCETQATTFERLAADAKEAIASEDTTKLHAKAATAFANVAMFTNLAIMK